MPRGAIRWDEANTTRLLHGLVLHHMINLGTEAQMIQLANYIKPGLPTKTVRDHFHRIRQRIKKEPGGSPAPVKAKTSDSTPAPSGKRAHGSANSTPTKRIKIESDAANSDDEFDKMVEDVARKNHRNGAAASAKGTKTASIKKEDLSGVNLSPTPKKIRKSLRSSPKKDYARIDDPFKEQLPDKIADSVFGTYDAEEDTENEYRPSTPAPLNLLNDGPVEFSA